jgi:nicotinamidase-related amidase
MGADGTTVPLERAIQSRDRRAVLLVDVFNDFAHEDGNQLCRSFLERFEGLGWLVTWARESGVPIAYANDGLPGVRCTREAIVSAAEAGRLGALAARIAPRDEDVFVVKPLYSGFEQTPLEALLRRLGVDELAVAGAASERCVAQTVTSARERGFECIAVTDACATVDPRLEAIAFDYLTEVTGSALVTTRELCGHAPPPTETTRRPPPHAARPAAPLAIAG